MDRYVRRELRTGVTEYPQGNQMITFSSLGNNIGPENVFYGNYTPEYPNMQPVNNTSGFMGVAHVNTPTFTANNYQSGQGHVVSGIDPTYLAAYSTNNAAYIATGQQAPKQFSMSFAGHKEFGAEYQNRNFLGIDKTKNVANARLKPFPLERQKQQIWKHKEFNCSENKKIKATAIESRSQQPALEALMKKTTEIDSQKNETQLPTMTRSEKLKALYKSGPRAFSGPVEKVLKWHKALQDIGVLVLYEIVAKCVSVRPGGYSTKNLVLRDESGPAMQVVYYEVDFYLPELKPHCTVRVIGRMMPGTCRLQAFSVRPATGDDVAMLARRAAVASHHIAKLCKEYGTDNTKV